MLENFQLAVIAKQGTSPNLLSIPLYQDLQIDLAENWQDQYRRFVLEIQEIDFNAGYTPEEHECFCLDDYTPPPWIVYEDSQTVPNLERISSNETLIESIKGVVAFARSGGSAEIVLFQNFNRSHLIRPGRFLFLEKNTYKTIQDPGITLDDKLAAVYLPNERKLLFRNYRTVNTFLPLEDFYKEASDQEIRDVLGHELLATQNPDSLVMGANQWFRKRFAMLKDSGVLDQYSAGEIRERSARYDVDIHISEDKIVFPSEKPRAKKVLQFLNEEIFRGAITENLYETNSKRQAD